MNKGIKKGLLELKKLMDAHPILSLVLAFMTAPWGVILYVVLLLWEPKDEDE